MALDAATLLAQELMRTAQAMRWLRSVTCLYGSAAASPDIRATPTNGMWRPQWDGFDRQMALANIVTPVNNMSGALTLRDLDNTIDVVTQNVAGEAPDNDYCFAMSRPMISSVNRLELANQRLMTSTMLRPRRDNGMVGSPVVEVEGGIETASYRGIPILPTSFVKPSGPTASGAIGTITASQPAGTAAVGTGLLCYQIVPITQYGPLYASAEVQITPTLTTNNITLSFATPLPTDSYGNTIPIIQYQVYKSHTTGAETLYGIVAANDAVDAPVTTITDNGTSLIANLGANQFTGAFFGTGTNNQEGDTFTKCWVANVNGSVEKIYLFSRNPDFLVVPEVTSLESSILAPINARSIQYAVVGDCALAMRANGFVSYIQGVRAA